MNWYLDVLKKYATFTGRATRQEYWMFTLIQMVISISSWVLIGTFAGMGDLAGYGIMQDILFGLSGLCYILLVIYNLATFLPSLAVLVRRLHDTGRSGWWVLISLVPVIGIIILIVFLCMDSQTGNQLDSQTGNNKYGPNPKLHNGENK